MLMPLEEGAVNYISEMCSCPEHHPRFDPCCVQCKAKIALKRREVEDQQNKIRQEILDEDKWPEPLVAERVGHHEDGSFTMCPEAYKQFCRMMKYSGRGLLSELSLPREVEELHKILYKYQRVSFEVYT